MFGLIVRASVLACISALVLVPAGAGADPERPAATVRDLRNHFAACFHPPSLTASTRITFYFSLNDRGGIIGQPRTTWLGFPGAASEKQRRIASFDSTFDRCLPVSLDRRMAATIPGEVYFLQYVVGASGREDQVLFRPFGSHGGIGEPLSVGPGFAAPEPQAAQPAIGAFRPTRPPTRSFVRPEIALPFRGPRAFDR